MENKLIVSLSPHVHGGDSVQKNMYGVLIALIPAFLVSLYFFGLGALIVTATSVAITNMKKKKIVVMRSCIASLSCLYYKLNRSLNA